MSAESDKKELKPSNATCVRFSPHEQSMIEKMERVTGMSKPALLKKALFKRLDLLRPLFLPEDTQKLIVELNRQGNNLNQIARKVNEGSREVWNQAFNSLTTAYFEIRRLISVGNGNSQN